MCITSDHLIERAVVGRPAKFDIVLFTARRRPFALKGQCLAGMLQLSCKTHGHRGEDLSCSEEGMS
jgi:hypothetical protein